MNDPRLTPPVCCMRDMVRSGPLVSWLCLECRREQVDEIASNALLTRIRERADQERQEKGDPPECIACKERPGTPREEFMGDRVCGQCWDAYPRLRNITFNLDQLADAGRKLAAGGAP